MAIDPKSPQAPPKVEHKDSTPEGLSIENILLAEFNYASSTAYQAMEDRARTFNLYLLIFGVLASGLGALYQLGHQLGPNTDVYAIALLIASGIMGITFFVTLVRFRQASRNSIIAMNVIKEYYIKHFEKTIPDIPNAFYWRYGGIPRGEKLKNAAFMISSTVAMLGSLCFAAAAVVLAEIWLGQASPDLLKLPPNTLPYIIGAVVFVVAFGLHVLYYRLVFRKSKDRQQLLETAHAKKIHVTLDDDKKSKNNG